MAKRGRKPENKTIDDLDETLRGEIDEALRSNAHESASSVFRRFGLAQRGLKIDTFIRYAGQLRRTCWTDEPPLDRTTPTLEEIKARLLVQMYESAQAGGMKAYEIAALFARVQDQDRIALLQEAAERAAEKHEAWKAEVSKTLRAAVEAKSPDGGTLSRADVYDLIDNVMRGKS